MRILTVLLTFFCFTANAEEPNLDQVRTLFETSATQKKAADQLVKLLAPITESSSPVLICYKGVAQMMAAKYGFNPINKFSSFKKGKNWIDEAAAQAPTNLEIRYLRFVIQSKLPSFLNYNDNIQEDKTYLLTKFKTTTDKKLQQNIVGFLRQSKYCSLEEKKGLKI